MSASHRPLSKPELSQFYSLLRCWPRRPAGSRCRQARYRARFGTRTVRSDGSGSATNVTGCNTKRGSSAGEVTITGADGNGWDLRSDTVKLDQHVGHQVTVTGTASHETKAEEKQGRAG